MRIEQIEDIDILLRNVNLLPITSLHASLSLYGFYYSCGTISVTPHPMVIFEEVETLLADSMIVVHRVINERAKILLLIRRHFLEAMKHLRVESELR